MCTTNSCKRTTPLLCYYAASSCDFLKTLRDNLAVPSSEVENPKEDNNNNNPEERILIYFSTVAWNHAQFLQMRQWNVGQ